MTDWTREHARWRAKLDRIEQAIEAKAKQPIDSQYESLLHERVVILRHIERMQDMRCV